MRPITFVGTSLDAIRAIPLTVKREAGYQLERSQRGLDPKHWKPMKTIGRGVREIRISHEGQYRVIYVAQFENTVYVLHAFKKKTQKTSKTDLDTAKRAFKQLLEMQA